MKTKCSSAAVLSVYLFCVLCTVKFLIKDNKVDVITYLKSYLMSYSPLGRPKSRSRETHSLWV